MKESSFMQALKLFVSYPNKKDFGWGVPKGTLNSIYTQVM